MISMQSIPYVYICVLLKHKFHSEKGSYMDKYYKQILKNTIFKRYKKKGCFNLNMTISYMLIDIKENKVKSLLHEGLPFPFLLKNNLDLFHSSKAFIIQLDL